MARLSALALSILLVACATEAPAPQAAPAEAVEQAPTTLADAAPEQEAAVASTAVETTAADAESECSVALSISGMMCDKMCPPRVETALMGVGGVAKVQVTYPDTATVFGNGTACADDGRPALIQALEAAGYGGAIQGAS